MKPRRLAGLLSVGLVSSLFATVACSSSSGPPGGLGTQPEVVPNGDAIVIGLSEDNSVDFLIRFTSYAGECDLYHQENSLRANATFAQIDISPPDLHGQIVPAGTYSLPVAVGHVGFTFSTLDGNCQGADVDATSGSVTLDQDLSIGSHAIGSYTFTLPDGATVTGTFDAPPCTDTVTSTTKQCLP